MSTVKPDFNLPTNAYATFDATSLKTLIQDRLTRNGVFTDQLFEGSNISSIIDIIAYSYHTLLFYLNRTSNEGMFTESQIYENINRIVKLIGYKPLGYQTSTLVFQLNASDQLAAGLYTIPRYSFIDVGGIKYSFAEDISFSKTRSGAERIDSVGDNYLLYQGEFKEYPTQTAQGEPFETFVLNLPNGVLIDYHNIDVYVKPIATQTFEKWTETSSLYNGTPTSSVYEKRLNENLRLEIKFGNSIHGKALRPGDEVYIYYLKSDGQYGVVGGGAINNNTPIPYTSVQFNDIRSDTKPTNLEFISFANLRKINLTNTVGSTKPVEIENIESIRENAPQFFRSQDKLTTTPDYTSYIKRNYGNILTDAYVANNEQYVNNHIKYVIDDLNISNPELESRIFYNQVNFATNTNFNNVYVYAVPRSEIKTSVDVLGNFLSYAQKQLIINGLRQNKTFSAEVIIQDPVYMAVDFGIQQNGVELSEDIIDDTVIQIIKSSDSQRSSETIKEQAVSTIKSALAFTNNSLGQTIDVLAITNSIKSIEGVSNVRTALKSNPSVRVNGLSLLVWNPAYPQNDIQIINQNTQLDFFKFPYLYSEANMAGKIQVITE